MSITPFERAWEQLAPAVFGALDDATIELRRPSSLESVGLSQTPKQLELAAAVAAGAATVSLRLPGSAKLRGELLTGTTLTIGAVAYKTTADRTADGTTLTVPVTPVLAAGFPIGTTVAISAQAAYTFEHCQVSRIRRGDVTGDVGAELTALLSIPTLGAPTTPKLRDIAYHVELSEVLGPIVSVPPTSSGFWKVKVGVS